MSEYQRLLAGMPRKLARSYGWIAHAPRCVRPALQNKLFLATCFLVLEKVFFKHGVLDGLWFFVE